MCLSASVSFFAGSLLLPIGAYTLTKAQGRDSRYLPLAGFPLLFGVQQLIEGALWIGLEGDSPQLQSSAALGFLFFAFFLWPILVPFAAWRLETDDCKRDWMTTAIVLGVLLGSVLYLPLLLDETRLMPAIARHSIAYHSFLITDAYIPRVAICLAYALLVGLPLVFSSRPAVKSYGVLLLISVLFSALFFHYAFTSIWCFFAAFLSLYSLRILRELPASQF